MATTAIAARELAARLPDSDLVVVDCRHALADFSLGRRLYDASHLPGAFFADVEHDLSGPKTGKNGRHPMPQAEAFAGFLRGLGVDDTTEVVAYDAGADMFAARFWFLCHWIGHESTAVLDGGFTLWEQLGLPVTAEVPQPRRHGTVEARVRDDLLVDAGHVHAHLERPAMQLVDARAADRFAGRNETVDPVAGHIPGARNRWFKANFNDDGTLKPPGVLRAEFAHDGLDPQRVVHQCGSGVSAAVNYWAMVHAGLEGSRLYGGSWSEWIADPSRPVVVS